MGTTVWPQPGYPWLLRLTATYRLVEDGLEVTLAARNESEHPAPYGVGQHPYLAAPGGVDSAVLTVPADRRLLMDDRSVPVGDEPVDGTPYDFRSGRAVGDLRLDEAYVALQPGPDGRVRVRLDETRWRPRRGAVVRGGDHPLPAGLQRRHAARPGAASPGPRGGADELSAGRPGERGGPGRPPAR